MMFTRYQGKAWETCFLPRLTSAKIADLPKEDALIVLPVGAVEQHGPHLPVMTDSLIGEATITKAFEELPAAHHIWLIPPLSYGKSSEHLGHAGTISLSTETLLALLMDIAISVQASGFRRLALVNSHGGNRDLLLVAARDIRIRTGLMVFFIAPLSLCEAQDIITAEEAEYGIHGGEVETSIVLAVKENWVLQDRVVREFPPVQNFEHVTMEENTRFAWVMSDLSASGISGDATKGTVEKGHLFWGSMAHNLASALLEMSTFELSAIRNQKINS